VADSSTLLFVSPRFLFPVDSGGKIRTTQILRGLKGGAFRIKLASPATPEQINSHRGAIETVCDEFIGWPAAGPDAMRGLSRLRHLFSDWPLPVRSDWSGPAAQAVAQLLAAGPSVAVFDFVHSAVLTPAFLPCPSVLFTHNVEAEIFQRHVGVARNPLVRWIWQSQARKMLAFEALTLQRFDVVVAVSERDAQAFAQLYGVRNLAVIPTGVDLEYFSFRAPDTDDNVVFCGSMDWLANQEAMNFFLDEVWDHVVADVPTARMTVIGRAPPQALVQRARRRGARWTFTGFVEDVRPHLEGATVSVIPMRVAGGTRLKVYEAMAAGAPVVSTGIGVEGLPVRNGVHFLQADEPAAFAGAVVSLLKDRALRSLIAAEARRYVESRFSYLAAAQAFQSACLRAVDLWHEGGSRAPRSGRPYLPSR